MSFMKYLLLWVLSVIFMSALDALWHFVLFGKAYSLDIKPLARLSGDKIVFNAPFGLLSQVLVVTCLFILVLLAGNRGGILITVIIGALAGILAISVYGLTNYALFRDWSLRLTILEAVWGPLLGGLSGLFIYAMRRVLVK